MVAARLEVTDVNVPRFTPQRAVPLHLIVGVLPLVAVAVRKTSQPRAVATAAVEVPYIYK